MSNSRVAAGQAHLRWSAELSRLSGQLRRPGQCREGRGDLGRAHLGCPREPGLIPHLQGHLCLCWMPALHLLCPNQLSSSFHGLHPQPGPYGQPYPLHPSLSMGRETLPQGWPHQGPGSTPRPPTSCLGSFYHQEPSSGLEKWDPRPAHHRAPHGQRDLRPQSAVK